MRYSVDVAEMAAMSGRARASADTIRAEAAALMGQIAWLEESWTGAAAAAFTQVAQEWHAASQAVDQALDSLSATLDAAAATYADTEAAATRLFAL